MRRALCILLVLLSAAVVVLFSQRTELGGTCQPAVPEFCPRDDPFEECPTCCCESSDNIEFYDPEASEPECTVLPALYEMKFVYTWTEVCHPNHFFENSLWISPVTISHNSAWRMWDACMADVTDGVGLFSQSGDGAIFLQEVLFSFFLRNILDFTRDELFTQPSGTTTSDVVVDKFHQYVSVISRQVPSPDHIVGVADLRLCDGNMWKERVKVCSELFSTATASDRVAGEMERNSVQGNNCSYGYVEFNLQDVHRFEPRTSLEQVCYPRVPEECPRDDPIEECPTCCCASSENIEFFNPDLPEPVCTAPTTAIYELKFVYTWSEICHPDYYFPDASFTYPTGASHNTVYRMWDACMDNVTIGVGIMSQLGDTSILDQEYLAAGDTILDTAVGEMVLAGVGESSINLTVNAYYQWVSAGLMLFPSVDRMVGVVDLRLCDGDVWKQSVKVCLELFSTATASEKIVGEMERNSLQANNCSFGYVEITLLEQFEPTPPEDICRPSVPNECPDGDEIIEECPTCCCASSENVEFYNPNVPEPECTALPALYEFNLVHTWTEECHPDDYVENSQWSRSIVVSHDTAYRMWDACMDDVSDGVGLFSQTADVSIIGNDLFIQLLAGFLIDPTGSDPVTQGSGIATNDIVLNRFHQYISVISRQVPSPDHIVGVADLRLCDGAAWKESVKVCFELFSTATAIDRAADPMERNSVQGNNCSYGYVEFNLQEVHEYVPRTALDEECYPRVPEKCPRDDPIEECPTCCCESSDNVEFYNPDLPEPKCVTDTAAIYEVKFVFKWNEICHPDYYFSNQVFTAPSIVSHNTEYRMWDACMDDASIGVGLLSQQGMNIIVEQEYLAAGDSVLEYVTGDIVFGGYGETSRNITVNVTHQWVSAASMLAPSPDRMVGVADLRLCDGYVWKQNVKVCLEQFSTAAATEKLVAEMERNSLQANNCSFGYIEFNLLSSAITKMVNIAVVYTALAAALILMN